MGQKILKVPQWKYQGKFDTFECPKVLRKFLQWIVVHIDNKKQTVGINYAVENLSQLIDQNKKLSHK